MIEMNKEAVEEVLRALQEPVIEPEMARNPNGHGAVVAVKEGYHIERLAGRMKQARVHMFHDIASFAAWLNRHAHEHAQHVEILAGERQIVAALTPGDPNGDVIQCMLSYHPEFEAWRRVFGASLTQRQLHEQIRSYPESFPSNQEGPSERDVLSGELQKLSVVAGKDMTSELDERGFYRFAGSSSRANVGGAIPPRFRISVPIFCGIGGEGQEEARYPLHVLLSMDLADDGVRFRLSCPSLDIVLHHARLHAVAYLRELLEDGFLVGLGDLALRDVPVVEVSR